jgi:FxsC-like protein
MLDLKRFRDDYRTFVFELAGRIVAVADTHRVPRQRGPMQLDQVPNVFSPDSALEGPNSVKTPRERVALGAPGRLSRRTFVHFVVVAGTRDEMSTIRGKLDYYGSSREDWAPYRPGHDDSLAEFATQVAGERLFDSGICDIARLNERIDQAKRRNEVVILLVDVWSPGLPDHKSALISYDARDDFTGAVMIPFNTSDEETLADTTVLQSQLAAILRRTLERRDRVMLRQNIPTPEQFGTDLEEILEVAQNRIFKKGIVNPQVPDRPSRSRPILEGPTSTMDGNLS